MDRRDRFSEAVRSVGHRLRGAAHDPVIVALALIVALGAALRLYFLIEWRPALIGFPDTSIYLLGAKLDLFKLPMRVDGYAVFLRILHLYPHLTFVILVQHAMGIASGLLLFATMRRAGMVRGLGLLPAGVVMLGGSELFVEHAPLTEALFIFLIDLALYCAVRAWRGAVAWAALAGVALGVAVDVRTIGLALLPLFAVVFALTARGAWRPRLVRSGALALAALIPVFAYLGAHSSAGYGFTFTQNGYYDLYARVAPFADCSKFSAPKGTEPFCIHVPLKQRPGHDYWEFTRLSPVVAYYGGQGPDFQHPVPRDENSKLMAFSLAAIAGQFGDYLTLVARDSLRLIDPNFAPEPRPSGIAGYGNTPEAQLQYYFNTANDGNVIPLMAAYYPGVDRRIGYGVKRGNVSLLKDWDRSTRIDGPLMAILLALALLAPLLARGQARRAAFLFGITTLVLLFGPILVSEYDWRFVIPALGPLAATAAIGGWALFERGRPLLTNPRSRPNATP